MGINLLSRLPGLVAVAGLLLQAGCTTIGYYAQSIDGHVRLMMKSEPIEELVAEPSTPAELKSQLQTVLEIRDFATRELGLPDNGSYRSFVDLDRKYVVWSVFAAPEFSLEPRKWCFPVVGCVNYRGYFSEERADAFADKLRQQGYDVYAGGVRAYSTLGWFADPVPNTILEQPMYHTARIVFHELAHQRLYIRDDTAFNEAFAVAVEREGMRRWLDTQDSRDLREGYARSREREQDFLDLVFLTRERLARLYDKTLSEVEKRERKTKIFSEMLAAYRGLKDRWGGEDAYDRWFARDLNNAKLASVATYNELVPAFEHLLAQHNGDLTAFYQVCEELAQEPHAQRHSRLKQFMTPSYTLGYLRPTTNQTEIRQTRVAVFL